eukprot:136545-Chlamydomonas_euryale.AAC.3
MLACGGEGTCAQWWNSGRMGGCGGVRMGCSYGVVVHRCCSWQDGVRRGSRARGEGPGQVFMGALSASLVGVSSMARGGERPERRNASMQALYRGKNKKAMAALGVTLPKMKIRA